jgi:hypothetical protein
VNAYGRIAKLASVVAVAVAATVGFFVAGCSEVIYPAVHDMPSARSDTPLTPDQVKQATDDLVSEREHLSTEVQANNPPTTGSVPPGTTASASQKKTAKQQQPQQPQAASAQPVPGETQAAAAYTRP